MKNSCCPTLCMILALAISAGAHSGGRLYPIAELTDEMLEKIQLHDGSADEWYDLVGEPTMSLVDFRTYGNKLPDPSDLDFRIWLAWRDDPDRLYVAFLGSDDVYIEPGGSHWHGFDGELILSVDGDHSGGGGYMNLSFDEAEIVWGEAQQYGALPRTGRGDPALYSYFTSSTPFGDGMGYSIDFSEDSWTVFPPYGDVGGDVVSENPIIKVIELYVTPFDRWLGYHSRPEDVVVSDLTAGGVIGFALVVNETDEMGGFFSLAPEAVRTEDAESDVLFHYRADLYLDGLLLPADPTGPQDGSAVESMTWGRIKASLDMR